MSGTVGTVAHVMRTYGIHGGERQLAQLFSTSPHGDFRNVFFFVYRDGICAQHFERISGLALRTLIPVRASAFPSLWLEIAILLFFLPALQLRTMYLLWRMKCTICVAHGLQGALVTWLAAYLLRNIRFAYVHRGTKSRLGRYPVFKLLYSPFDMVAGVSKASAESLADLVHGGKPLVLENGIDWQAIERRRAQCNFEKGNAFVISCVGRLMPAKGQRLLLRAFAIFHARHPASELWMIGDGPDRSVLERSAAELGVADKVRFFGYCSEVVCVLAGSDVFAHASESEGLSNAVLEAMTLGLPSVVVDAPGVSECHIEGTTGFVVAREEQAIAEKLSLFVEDCSLRIRMGKRARERVRMHYSIQANCERYIELYQRLLGA